MSGTLRSCRSKIVRFMPSKLQKQSQKAKTQKIPKCGRPHSACGSDLCKGFSSFSMPTRAVAMLVAVMSEKNWNRCFKSEKKQSLAKFACWKSFSMLLRMTLNWDCRVSRFLCAVSHFSTMSTSFTGLMLHAEWLWSYMQALHSKPWSEGGAGIDVRTPFCHKGKQSTWADVHHQLFVVCGRSTK